MVDRVLMVDDEEKVLSAYRRQLRPRFAVDTALSGQEALATLEAKGPYAIVISDMRMPGMDGVELLRRVREQSPSSVRMMLTGNADVRTAVEAVNEGHIFRFLQKPCPPPALFGALEAGMRQYRLETAERELLDKTLAGSVAVLTEILSVIDPESFRHAQSLQRRLEVVIEELELEDAWELRIAAMLLRLGNATLPPAIAHKARSALAGDELAAVAKVPEVGSELLLKIPRLETVAGIVRYQDKRYDGTGFPADRTKGASIPRGARLLKILGDMVELEVAEGRSAPEALEIISRRAGWYDPELLDALASVASRLAPASTLTRQRRRREIKASELRVGDILAADVLTTDGKLLISAMHEISRTLLDRIRNFARFSGVREPVAVFAAVETPEPAPSTAGTGRTSS